jgi:Histidine kinase-, DNA gyrase B-, and HSP90-like ATPase
VKEVRQAPRASAILNSLRAIGYSFNTAIADIVDNSIAAGARAIDIAFDTSPTWVSIRDNGCGMSEDELVAAMRHGGNGLEVKRDAGDLGRYGLGLKTASLSQCRRLTVVTLRGGDLAAARWDLDNIEKRDDWILDVLDRTDIESLPTVSDLLQTDSGTVVIWEVFDRAVAGEAKPDEALQKLALECGDHLSLVFHRFLSAPGTKQLEIRLNNRQLTAADPFLKTHPFTELVGIEKVNVDGHALTVKAFILPHITKLSQEDLQRAGGKERLHETQGFYLYRNMRLIIWGTWFRLLGRTELTRLARVQIDIPNALDHLWNLDVKKSAAAPPEAVRRVMRQIIDTVAAKSANVFRERRRRIVDISDTIYFWERSTVREGIRYDINRQHPLLATFSAHLSAEQIAQLDRILIAIEEALPVRTIYTDQASDVAIDQGRSDLEDRLPALLNDLVAATSRVQDRNALLDSLSRVEPFNRFPEIMRTFRESVG